MARKTPEQKLADVINEIGFEKAESAFKLLKAYQTKPVKKAPKPEVNKAGA